MGKAEQTRVRILDAAEKLFADRGFGATRLEDVATEVGVRRAALFYHFPDKRALYTAVLESVFDGLLERVRATLGERGRDLQQRLEAAVLAFVDYVFERPATAHLLLREAAQRTSEPEDIARLGGPFLELVHQFYGEGVRRGLFRPLAAGPFHFCSTIVGSTIFFVAGLPRLVPDLPFNPLAGEQLDAHRRDVLLIMRRLLEVNAPTTAQT